MEYFALLAVATTVIVVLAAALYRKRRDAGTLVGIAALYYWSLYGAWFIVIDKTGGFSGKNYQYLESKLFPIALDGNYLLTLGLYAGFIILVELTLLAAVEPPRENRASAPLLLRHEPILLIGLGAGVASLLLVADKLGAAWALHMSAYEYTRSQTDEWFTLHQVLNRVALIPPAIGLAVLAAGKRSRVLVSAGRRYTLWAYLALLAGMGVFTFVLGNKNEVLVALVAGVLAYLGSARKTELDPGGAGDAGRAVVSVCHRFLPRGAAGGFARRGERAGGGGHRTGAFPDLEQRGLRRALFDVRRAGQGRGAALRLQPVFAGLLGDPARAVARPAAGYLSVLQRKRGRDSKPGLLAASRHRLVSQLRIRGRGAGRGGDGTGVGVLPERAPPRGLRTGVPAVCDGGAVAVRGVSAASDSRRAGGLQRVPHRRRADSGGRAGLRLPSQEGPRQARLASASAAGCGGR